MEITNRFIVFIVLIVLIFYGCRNGGRGTNFEDTAYTPDTSSDNIGCNVFDFEYFRSDSLWQWFSTDKIKPIDSNFYSTHLKNYSEISYWKDYQTLYLVCMVKTKDIQGCVIAQRVHNDAEANMFLVYGPNNATGYQSIILVAKIEKSPDDFYKLKSILTEKGLVSTALYMISEGESMMKDSIVSEFKISKDKFEKIKTDSVRITVK